MDAFFSLGPNPSAHQGGLGESQCLPNRETRQRGMKVGLASRTLGLGKGWRVLGAPPQSCRAEGTGQPRRRLTLHATVCQSARVPECMEAGGSGGGPLPQLGTLGAPDEGGRVWRDPLHGQESLRPAGMPPRQGFPVQEGNWRRMEGQTTGKDRWTDK